MQNILSITFGFGLYRVVDKDQRPWALKWNIFMKKNMQSLLIPRFGKNVFMPLKELREAY